MSGTRSTPDTRRSCCCPAESPCAGTAHPSTGTHVRLSGMTRPVNLLGRVPNTGRPLPASVKRLDLSLAKSLGFFRRRHPLTRVRDSACLSAEVHGRPRAASALVGVCGRLVARCDAGTGGRQQRRTRPIWAECPAACAAVPGGTFVARASPRRGRLESGLSKSGQDTRRLAGHSERDTGSGWPVAALRLAGPR